MEPLNYTLNFNFGNGIDKTPDIITRNFQTKTITVKDGANGQIQNFNTDNSDEMNKFFGALAMIGTDKVYPAKFAPCPHHPENGNETIAFALPIAEYNRLSAEALKHNCDFNGDGTPDTAYVNPNTPNFGYVHIEPTR